MYHRLDEVPLLDSYPSKIPAPVWNVWRRYRNGAHFPNCFPLEGFAPMSLLIDQDSWAIVDSSLYDLPILAWIEFDEPPGRAIHEPVACVVRQYHQGATKIRAEALQQLQQELETRLEKQRGRR